MENGRKFEMDVRLGAVTDVEADEMARYLNPREGAAALEFFADTLRALGLDVEVSRHAGGRMATVTVLHPYPHQAERLRNRGGGRPRVRPSWPEELGGNDRERLAWLEAHTEEEGMSALGCSRSTLYRRMRLLRATVSDS